MQNNNKKVYKSHNFLNAIKVCFNRKENKNWLRIEFLSKECIKELHLKISKILSNVYFENCECEVVDKRSKW